MLSLKVYQSIVIDNGEIIQPISKTNDTRSKFDADKAHLKENLMSTQTTIATSAAAASSTQAVVSHDAANDAKGVAVTYAFIDQLVVERQTWEVNAFRTSNEQLYVLLQKCYQFYKQMGDSTTQAAALRSGLNDYVNLKGVTFAKTTHTLAKIVKCVFGADRRRVSAYSIALRMALDKGIAVLDIPAFIRDAGGIEELRLDKSTSEASNKQKVIAAASVVNACTLGVASGVGLGKLLDSGKVGTQVVLIGTWQADGSVTVRAIVESDGVLNAALSSFYSANKKALAASAKETKAANDATATQTAIANAVLQAA